MQTRSGLKESDAVQFTISFLTAYAIYCEICFERISTDVETES